MTELQCNIEGPVRYVIYRHWRLDLLAGAQQPGLASVGTATRGKHVFV